MFSIKLLHLFFNGFNFIHIFTLESFPTFLFQFGLSLTIGLVKHKLMMFLQGIYSSSLSLHFSFLLMNCFEELTPIIELSSRSPFVRISPCLFPIFFGKPSLLHCSLFRCCIGRLFFYNLLYNLFFFYLFFDFFSHWNTPLIGPYRY